jgi:Pyruvate/2-oxoacid:ferredoxin oxidoreductase delta subunit/coenzyme F420-reducing hydrogenase delta subunit
VAVIESRIFLGDWARSIHRYSADLALVAVVVHLVRKLIQGQTWGPRALAWVSGVVMLGVVLACGWTGLVLVWDRQGQRIAVEGARLFDLLPIFSEPISRMFAGDQPVPRAFFFMNLFAHVALPLGIAALLWLHLVRVARPVLLPPKPLRRGVVATILFWALVAPVPLAPEADLAALPDRMPTDLLFAFWLPVAQRLVPSLHLALWAALFAALVSCAWIWRPRRSIAASVVDEDHCSGCTSCYQECPYDAIAMVRRERPSRQTSELVARVDSSLCVGCGICAAACAPMGVGPPGRTGREQLAEFRTVLDESIPPLRELVVLTCRSGWPNAERDLAGTGRLVRAGGCAGSIHTSVVELLLRRGVRGVAIVSCPPRNCSFREGPKWLAARISDGKEAELHARVDRRRVAILSHSPGELGLVRSGLAELERRIAALEIEAEAQVELLPECDLEAAREASEKIIELVHG